MSWRRALSLAGVCASLYWMALAFYPPQCAPVAPASEVFCNRLWTPGLLGMGLGYAGLFLRMRRTLSRAATVAWILLLAGLALMLLGNGVEYWLLYRQPHAGPAGLYRGLAWMTVLSGFLAVQVGAAAAGGLGLRAGQLPRITGALMVALLPLTLAAGAAGLRWAGLPIGITSLAVSLSAWRWMLQ